MYNPHKCCRKPTLGPQPQGNNGPKQQPAPLAENAEGHLKEQNKET